MINKELRSLKSEITDIDFEKSEKHCEVLNRTNIKQPGKRNGWLEKDADDWVLNLIGGSENYQIDLIGIEQQDIMLTCVKPLWFHRGNNHC